MCVIRKETIDKKNYRDINSVCDRLFRIYLKLEKKTIEQQLKSFAHYVGKCWVSAGRIWFNAIRLDAQYSIMEDWKKSPKMPYTFCSTKYLQLNYVISKSFIPLSTVLKAFCIAGTEEWHLALAIGSSIRNCIPNSDILLQMYWLHGYRLVAGKYKQIFTLQVYSNEKR